MELLADGRDPHNTANHFVENPEISHPEFPWSNKIWPKSLATVAFDVCFDPQELVNTVHNDSLITGFEIVQVNLSIGCKRDLKSHGIRVSRHCWGLNSNNKRPDTLPHQASAEGETPLPALANHIIPQKRVLFRAQSRPGIQTPPTAYRSCGQNIKRPDTLPHQASAEGETPHVALTKCILPQRAAFSKHRKVLESGRKGVQGCSKSERHKEPKTVEFDGF
ncbi:MAG: hypothetical protein HYV26_00980 [Candidatus Hydrogenedentes bacterium]|nr:hypothetical protein [Candidatus Hydrogenedentota bacterium]